MNSSNAWMEVDEMAALSLQSDIDRSLRQLVDKKKILKQKIQASMELARARYTATTTTTVTGGDDKNKMAAILAMRQAHQQRNRKAYLLAARFQLEGLAKRIDFGLRQGGQYNLDMAELRRHAELIIDKADTVEFPVPSNDELLQQLHNYMESLEANGLV